MLEQVTPQLEVEVGGSSVPASPEATVPTVMLKPVTPQPQNLRIKCLAKEYLPMPLAMLESVTSA